MALDGAYSNTLQVIGAAALAPKGGPSGEPVNLRFGLMNGPGAEAPVHSLALRACIASPATPFTRLRFLKLHTFCLASCDGPVFAG